MNETQLHDYIRDFNWDGDAHEIFRLLDHPMVARATALMAYWLLEGPWHGYSEIDHGDHPHAEEVALLQQRLLSGFYAEADLRFSAFDDYGLSKVQAFKFRKQGLPEALLTS